MAVASLNQLGIRPGDRIAVVGFNSTRYFVVDVAIGLAGCVSVPLYYASPIGALMAIIDACSARLFFVGTPEILMRLAGAGMRIPVVSFCRETPDGRVPPNFMRWEDFLALGAGDQRRETPLRAPTGFGDVATLRYTSGTTGRPKGAVFTHANLRRMAESLASLPPWTARTRRVVYLSFLPMNHVVEGILASYALYYTPAPVDVYYLEDFHELQGVLPRTRPTVFFSAICHRGCCELTRIRKAAAVAMLCALLAATSCAVTARTSTASAAAKQCAAQALDTIPISVDGRPEGDPGAGGRPRVTPPG